MFLGLGGFVSGRSALTLAAIVARDLYSARLVRRTLYDIVELASLIQLGFLSVAWRCYSLAQAAACSRYRLFVLVYAAVEHAQCRSQMLAFTASQLFRQLFVCIADEQRNLDFFLRASLWAERCGCNSSTA